MEKIWRKTIPYFLLSSPFGCYFCLLFCCCLFVLHFLACWHHSDERCDRNWDQFSEFSHPKNICCGVTLLADFWQGLLKKNEKKLSQSFNFTFTYTDDFRSLNNYRFGEFVDRIYSIELEITDTTDTDRSASYLEIDSEGLLSTKLYDKRDDFNLPIVNFAFICSNIPAAPAYGVPGIYLSVDTIFQSLWFLSGFPWSRVAANKEATEPMVPFC
jgi:hypothetical protein